MPARRRCAVFDTATRERVATVPLAREGAAYSDTMLGRAALPIGVVVDPAAPRVYVAISGGDRIAVIDTTTGRSSTTGPRAANRMRWLSCRRTVPEKAAAPPAGLGTRVSRYRCCLPALAEFST